MTDTTQSIHNPLQRADGFSQTPLAPGALHALPDAPAEPGLEETAQLATSDLEETPLLGELVFFFDGEFRTLEEVERRAALNAAISAHLARMPARGLRQAA